MIEKKLKNLPNSPGIYLFYNNKNDLIYVGKATNLKTRVASYFRNIQYLISNIPSRPIEEMIHEVKNIKYKTTDSVLEAIILESLYIKKYQPKYNVLGRDDKSWNYVVITNDKYPRVETIREHELKGSKLQAPSYKNIYGPYPGLKTREALKILRRLFKFSTCQPNQKHPCLYRQMNECSGVCTDEITPADYKQKVIRPLKLFLQGKKERVIKNLEKAMAVASRNQEFEEAGRLRNQINSLRRFQDVALINNDFYSHPLSLSPSGRGRNPTPLLRKEGLGEVEKYRIEGYDISNISGASAVGSMVVFTNGEPDKSQYRKFKIRTITQANDVGMLKEVLKRRFKNDWPLPQLILIDGGLPQVNTAKDVLHGLNLSIPIIGIAKGPDRKKNEIVGVIPPVTSLKTLIAVRDEAHRFAVAYHRKLRFGGG
jgi:excinuclease ABC subunit C